MGVGVADVALLLAMMQGVFSKTWNLTLPQRIVSISNSCVTLPCHFEVPDSQEANILNCSNRAVWKKGSHLHPKNVQGEIIGDLTKKNCTTMMSSFPNIHNDVYFFRLDCPNLKYSFPNGVNIDIQTETPRPQLTFMSQMSEGGHAKLQCQTPVSCSVLPPSLTWSFRDPSSQEESQVTQSTDGSMIMTSTLTFVASADHHNQTILCSASYPLLNGGSSSAMTSQRLSVLYAPRFTTATLSPSGPVFEGETVMLMCSSDANPPVSHYIWFRDERGKLRAIAQEQTLELQVSLSHSGRYLCEARSLTGSERSRSVFLQVSATQAAAGSSVVSVMMTHIISGVLCVLYILLVVFNLYKCHSLSRRLKKIELKGEHTYTDLKTIHVNSDYDQLQLKPKPPPEDPEYENSISMQVTVRDQPQLNGH